MTFSLKKAVLAFLSVSSSLLVNASPTPKVSHNASAEAAADLVVPRDSLGYHNAVYFTNWYLNPPPPPKAPYGRWLCANGSPGASTDATTSRPSFQRRRSRLCYMRLRTCSRRVRCTSQDSPPIWESS